MLQADQPDVQVALAHAALPEVQASSDVPHLLAILLLAVAGERHKGGGRVACASCCTYLLPCTAAGVNAGVASCKPAEPSYTCNRLATPA